MVRRWWLVYGA